MFVPNPNHTGNVAEAGVIFHAVKAGVRVLTPVAEHGPYDAVIEVGERLLRIQVKSGKLSDTGDVVVARLSRCRRGPTGGYIVRKYSADEIDAFAIYCAELDRCYLVPADEVIQQSMIYLRLDEPRNGQRASLRFAAEYELLGAVAQLAERSAGSRKVRGSNPLSSTDAIEDREPDAAVGADEFRNRFGWYMERAAAGEEILVRRRGKPYVRLVPNPVDSTPVPLVDLDS